MMVHCNKCEGRGFRTISALRKHQWAKHVESFDNLKAAATRRAKPKRGRPPKALVKLEPSRPRKVLVKLEPSPIGQQPLLAVDLLEQLQTQHRFLSDVVSLISSIIAQHEENK